MPKELKLKRKTIPTIQRLPTETYKRQLLDRISDMIKSVLRILSESKMSIEKKEETADFFLFVMNILDIENEKLSYEKIKLQKSKRTRRALPKA